MPFPKQAPLPSTRSTHCITTIPATARSHLFFDPNKTKNPPILSRTRSAAQPRSHAKPLPLATTSHVSLLFVAHSAETCLSQPSAECAWLPTPSKARMPRSDVTTIAKRRRSFARCILYLCVECAEMECSVTI